MINTNPFETINEKISALDTQLKDIGQAITLIKHGGHKSVLTLPELAKFLGFSHQTIYRIVSRNDITFSKIGGKLFFKMDDIIHYLDKNRILSKEKVY